MLIGEIPVAEITAADLSKLLVEQTSHRLGDPEVMVDLIRSSEKTIYVGGEAGRPSAVPSREGLSPVQTVLIARGSRETALLDSLILVQAQNLGNNLISRKINLEEVVMGGVKVQILLAPTDIKFMPRTAIANANIWVRQHVKDLLPSPTSRFPSF
jgi:protein involved in polysaccharide export with SLBB domain